MRGRKDPNCDWDPMLGLAILKSRTKLYQSFGLEPRALETMAAFMGVSREAVRLEIEKIMRKLRIRIRANLSTLGYDLHEGLKAYGKNGRHEP